MNQLQAEDLLRRMDNELSLVKTAAKQLAKRAKEIRDARQILREASGIDRRKVWADKRVAAGKCVQCGSEKAAKPSKYGKKCLKKASVRAAKRRAGMKTSDAGAKAVKAGL